jgi:hypothetical protein
LPEEPLAKCSRRLQPALAQALVSLCHWVLIEETEKFPDTERVLQEPQKVFLFPLYPNPLPLYRVPFEMKQIIQITY